MRLSTFVRSEEDLIQCALSGGVTEVLIEPALSARLGQLTVDEARELAISARAKGLSPVLVWDILMIEEVFLEVVATLQRLDFAIFSAVRVFDLGAAWWVAQHTGSALQLICEVANKNLTALQGWLEVFEGRLSRLILSPEIPEGLLGELCRSLPCEIEVLGAGRIELFYTPRKLLSPNFDQGNGLIQVGSRTPESPSREYPTVESAHGTFMYLHRDRFVLDRVRQLRGAGVDVLRIDLRHLSKEGDSAQGIVEIAASLDQGEAGPWPTSTCAPFKHSNKTTRRFGQLRSRRAGVRDESFVGEVISAEKPRYTIFRSFRSTSLQGPFRLVLPEGGEERIVSDLQFRSALSGEQLLECEEDQVLIATWVKRATPGATLFKYVGAELQKCS